MSNVSCICREKPVEMLQKRGYRKALMKWLISEAWWPACMTLSSMSSFSCFRWHNRFLCRVVRFVALLRERSLCGFVHHGNGYCLHYANYSTSWWICPFRSSQVVIIVWVLSDAVIYTWICFVVLLLESSRLWSVDCKRDPKSTSCQAVGSCGNYFWNVLSGV